MQKRFKMLIAVALMLWVVCAVPIRVSAAGDVAINESNFPDGTFS